MKKLLVRIEKQGQFFLAGTIAGEGASDARFAYDRDYLSDRDSTPISVRFPLREEPFSPMETRCFFEGLLPDGFLRRCAAVWVQADPSDYLSMLETLGADTPGALRISAAEGGEDAWLDGADYKPVTDGELHELAAEGATRAALLMSREGATIGGSAGKAGLYRPPSGGWYIPASGAAGTHILKQSHVRKEHTVENELLALKTAQKLGISTATAMAVLPLTGERKSAENKPLLASVRYDRAFPENVENTNFPRPLRRHQEDMAQALGIPVQLKEEPEDGRYLRRMFDLLRDWSEDPIEDRLELWRRTVFNALIGNHKNHIKNVSLLYRDDHKSLRLAPACGLSATAVYAEGERFLRLPVGGARTLRELDRAALARAASEVGLGRGFAMDVAHELTTLFPSALAASARELSEAGLPAAETLAKRLMSKNA